MSDYVAGIVTKITGKPTKGKSKIWNIQIDDEDWFGYGFDKPDFGEGSEVEFDIEWNGDFANVDKETFEVLELVEARRSSSRSSGGRSGGRSSGGDSGRSRSGGRSSRSNSSRGGKPSGGKRSPQGSGGKKEVDWDRKDKLIRLQSCQNTAIAYVSAAVLHGALPLPKAKGKGEEAFAAAVEEEAERLFRKYDDIADNGYDNPESGEEEQYEDD